MEVPLETKVILPQEKDLMMITEPGCQEIEELIDNLIEIEGIIDLQSRNDIHPDEDHQDHQEEDLLVPQDILDPLETRDYQDPLWDHRDHLDRLLDYPIYLDPLPHHK